MVSLAVKHFFTAVIEYIRFRWNNRGFGSSKATQIWDERALERQKRYTWQVENMLRAVKDGDMGWATEHLGKREGRDLDVDGGEFLEIIPDLDGGDVESSDTE